MKNQFINLDFTSFYVSSAPSAEGDFFFLERERGDFFVVTDETFLGKPLEFVIVDMISAVNAKTAKDSTRDVVQKTIGIYANIVGAGALINSNTEQNFIVEQADSFVGSPATSGTGAFTLTTTTDGSSVGTLQTALRALGTVDSVNLSTATATATKLGVALGNVVS